MAAGSKRLGLTVEWTRDSSKVIVTTKHDKWDMIVGSSLVGIRDGQADQPFNLLNAINREMAPDFRKSKAEATNQTRQQAVTPIVVAADTIRTG